MRWMLRGWLVLLVLSSMGAGATDQPIEVADGVPGRLMLPEDGAPRGAVLLVHGWNGHMNEVGDLYLDLAHALAERGIASLRFDFSGEGLRTGFLVTSTFESRMAEAEAATEVLAERVPDVPLGLVGFSLGGLVSMELVGRQPRRFETLVLWSATASMGSAGEPAFIEAAREALRDGRGVYRSYADITLTREFLVSYFGVDTSRGLQRFPGSLLAIRGTRDFLPSLDVQWLQATPSDDDAFLLIGGADHIFDVLADPDPGHGVRVIRETADWFEERM